MGKSIRTWALAALLWAPLAQAADAAAAVDLSQPEAVVEAMSGRAQARDWKGVAALFDPAALKDFRGLLAPLVALAAKEAPEAGAGPDPRLALLFAGMDAKQLAGASDADFFAAYMGGMVNMAQADVGKTEILGSVAEGEDRRHVVVRSTASAMGIAITKMQVVSLRHRAEGWRIELSGDVRGMAEAMNRQLSGEGGEPKPDPAAVDKE